MLKSRTGNDQSVQTVTCAICGDEDTFVMVNRVVSLEPAGAVMFTSKNGSNRVAAGMFVVSHESSLLVVVGFRPFENVAFGCNSNRFPAPNADPAIASMATRAKIISFLIYFISPTLILDETNSSCGQTFTLCRITNHLPT